MKAMINIVVAKPSRLEKGNGIRFNLIVLDENNAPVLFVPGFRIVDGFFSAPARRVGSSWFDCVLVTESLAGAIYDAVEEAVWPGLEEEKRLREKNLVVEGLTVQKRTLIATAPEFFVLQKNEAAV